MVETKKLIPKRRFKEFQNAGAWEQCKLGRNASFLKGQGYSKKDLIENGVPIILYGRLYTNYETTIREVSTFVEGTSNSILSKGNEVIVPASGETAEDIARASAVEKSGIILGGDLNIIYPNDNIGSTFLALLISNGQAQRELSSKAQGKSVVHLRNPDLKDLELYFPKIDEQREISRYFDKVDSLITLHQRKLDKIKSTKKAYLYEMFPAEGESKPKRRFKGFTDDWEQCKLGDLGQVSMNRRIFKDQTSDKGEIPFFKIGTFGREPDACISRELFEEYKSKYPYPKVGDILISASGSIGRTVEFTGKDEYFQDSNIVWLEHDERLRNPFLKQFYSVVKWDGLEGSTIKRLYNKNILDTQIMLPEPDEQEQIGKFFNDLDNLITLHQRKLDKLKDLKNAYLNEMFI